MKAVASVKKITWQDMLFWFYFILQYLFPVFLILPFLNPDVCGFECPNKDTTGAVLGLFLIFSFFKLKKTFPKKAAEILKVFLPLLISASAFVFLYGFDALMNDARVYGFVSVSSTFFAIVVWVLFNSIKNAFRTRRHVVKKIGELLIMLIGFSIYAIPMIKIARVLMKNATTVRGSDPTVLIIYVLGTFCLLSFSLFHYFWKD